MSSAEIFTQHAKCKQVLWQKQYISSSMLLHSLFEHGLNYVGFPMYSLNYKAIIYNYNGSDKWKGVFQY